MSQFYEVKLVATRVVVIDIPDDYRPGEDRANLACQLAETEVFPFCSDVEAEACKLGSEHEIEQAKRHADEVI